MPDDCLWFCYGCKTRFAYGEDDCPKCGWLFCPSCIAEDDHGCEGGIEDA